MQRTRRRTEERILEAARQLFLRYGIDETSMGDIARETGVAEATLYRSWPSEDALCGSSLYREIRAVNRAFLARVEVDPKEDTIVYHAFAATYDRPFLRASMTTESRTLGSYLRRHRTVLSHWQFRLDRALVEALQEAGVLRSDLAPELLTDLRSAVSLGPTSAAESTPPAERPWKGVADTVQRALAPPGGGDSARGKEVLRRFIVAIDEGLEELERATRRLPEGDTR
ncbi:MAG: helix-turn-helix domain-containing protein [Thermomicrobium sp.]|nr:TetR/AcrR family transcriptional regulator [Thermomicrobium sp.]MDW8058842.1 helix-turn-helix domain-containing protein [Thermomicrobium sp.]